MTPITPVPAAGGAAPPADIPARVLQLLAKDHLGPAVIRSLAALDGVVPLLAGLATGAQPSGCYERENAIYALGMLGADAAVPDLVHILWIADPNEQLLAARALGRIGNATALAELRRRYQGYTALTPPVPPSYTGRAEPSDWAPPAPRIAEASGAWPTAAPPEAGNGAGTRALPSALALELRDILAR